MDEDNAAKNIMLNPANQKNEEEEIPKGFKSKAKCFLNNISVEPVLLFFQVSSIMSSLTTQNLNLQKACRVNLNYSDAICYGIEHKNSTIYKNEEIVVQKLVANMLIWQTILQSSVPCILVIFIGSWSDRHKTRKPFILLPILGELVRNVGLILCVYFFYELPMEIAGLVESIPSSVSGGMAVFYMASFSYIIDITTEKNRTMRIGFFNISFGTAWPIGAALSGIVFQKLGFYGVYYASTILFSISLIIALVLVRERRDTQSNEAAIKSDKNGCMFNVMDFFSLRHVKSAFQVTFKKEPYDRWLKVVMIMVLYVIVEGPVLGQNSVEYLFTKLKFDWNEVDYSIFSTFLFMLMITGMGVTLGIFSKMFNVDDSMIGLIAVTSKFFSGFVYAFAPTGLIFYFGAIIELLFASSYIILRSILSKIVPKHEMGQVCSILAILQTLVPVIYKPLYSAIYNLTLETFPGFFLIFSSILLIPAFFIYLWLYLESKRSRSIKKLVE